MIAWVMVAGHALIGNVIDIDHWRHVYLLFGIVWGCAALESRHQRAERQKRMAASPADRPLLDY